MHGGSDGKRPAKAGGAQFEAAELWDWSIPEPQVGSGASQAVVSMYEQEYPEAMKCLATDLEEVLTALRFPESHRKRISNDEFIGAVIWRRPSPVQSRSTVHERRFRPEFVICGVGGRVGRMARS